MKTFFKFLFGVALAAVAVRGILFAIDYLYEKYGKRYISA